MRPFALALFDLLAGPLLDKALLVQGIRVASMRRIVLAVATIVVGHHLASVAAAWTWADVVALALLLFALDLQGAITAAPVAAFGALGTMVGRAAGGVRSAYTVARSAWGPGVPPSDERGVL